MPPAADPGNLAAQAQGRLNDLYGFGLPVTGTFDDTTKRAVVRVLQTELNHHYNAGLRVDGILGPNTRAALQNIGAGSPGNLPLAAQLLLMLRGYDPGTPDGRYGPLTTSAMQIFQRDQYLLPVGIATKQSLERLIDG
jgi:peptidoglycan L-alanyl-D-glutamate endopeptidase CwlK